MRILFEFENTAAAVNSAAIAPELLLNRTVEREVDWKAIADDWQQVSMSNEQKNSGDEE